jgi:hypothetical protein
VETKGPYLQAARGEEVEDGVRGVPAEVTEEARQHHEEQRDDDLNQEAEEREEHRELQRDAPFQRREPGDHDDGDDGDRPQHVEGQGLVVHGVQVDDRLEAAQVAGDGSHHRREGAGRGRSN